MKEIENNIYIAVGDPLLDADTQTFTSDFSKVPFIPDEMIVKQISFFDSGVGNLNQVAVKCDFLQSDIAIFCRTGVFENQVNINLENNFKLNGANIQGTHTFTVYSPIGEPGHVEGSICMLLEFVKYKK